MFRADPVPWRSPLKGVHFSRGCPTSSSAVEEGASGPLWGPVLANPPPWAVLSGLGVVYGLIPGGSCSVEVEIFLLGLFPRKYHTELMLRERPGFQGAAE